METLIDSLDDPVLDIGCGRYANLVEHLNWSGLRAEGIDPELVGGLSDKKYYLMKQKADNIPREDGYYGTAISHMSVYQ